MGNIWIPRMEISHQLLMVVIEKSEEKVSEIEERTLDHDKSMYMVFVAYIVVSCLLSLRDNEVLILDLGVLIRNWKVGRDDHIAIVLWDELRGKISRKEHKIPCI